MDKNSPSELVELKKELQVLKRSSDLEKGRSQVLRMVAHGDDIKSILNTLCKNALQYNPNMYCSILRLDNTKNTLHPIASIALPDFYCAAIDGVSIGSSVGSCGTAAFTQKRVIVEDINTHPYWTLYKDLALSAGLQSCWSEPIIGKEGIVFGTFAIYYNKPTSPSEEDLLFIETSASLAAVVFDNIQTRKALIAANQQLEKTVDQRTQELEQANKELNTTLQKQNEAHIQHINTEKILTTKSLVSGFAQDIGAPLSLALTSIGTAESKLNELTATISAGKLSRTGLKSSLNVIAQSIAVNQNNLQKASGFLAKFEEINIELNQDLQPFELNALFNQLDQTLNDAKKQHKVHFEADKVIIPYCKDALWLVLYQLIENSVLHGFEHMNSGEIFISGTNQKDKVVITYHDNGCGIPHEIRKTIFEPFYTSKKHQGNTGLGMCYVANILSTSLNGSIELIDSPVGTRFEIVIKL